MVSTRQVGRPCRSGTGHIGTAAITVEMAAATTTYHSRMRLGMPRGGGGIRMVRGSGMGASRFPVGVARQPCQAASRGSVVQQVSGSLQRH
jgi:hypothetical protein